MHRYDQDGQIGGSNVQVLDQLEAMGIFEREIDYDQIWPPCLDDAEGLMPILGLATNFQIILAFDNFGQSSANQWMIIDQHDTRGASGLWPEIRTYSAHFNVWREDIPTQPEMGEPRRNVCIRKAKHRQPVR